MSTPALVEIIARVAPGAIERDSIVGIGVDIDVRRNDEFDRLRLEDPDGFVFFRFYLDIEWSPRTPQSSQVTLVVRLLQHLWAQGITAVAACDFEDELPYSGGYRSGWRYQP